MEKKRKKKNHRRDGLPAEAMKELGRLTFSPDTTSGGGSPGSLLRVSLTEKVRILSNFLHDDRKDEN